MRRIKSRARHGRAALVHSPRSFSDWALPFGGAVSIACSPQAGTHRGGRTSGCAHSS